MKVEIVAVDSLTALEGNPRHHSAEQIKLIKESIERFGFTNPILAHKDRTVIAGHGRLDAAKNAGLDTVPVIFLDMDKPDAMLYAIADNQLSELSKWNDENLAKMAKELDEMGLNLQDAGFRIDEVETLVGDKTIGEEKIEEDDIETLAQLGDLWELGKHRVLCGDSGDASDVDRVLDGATPNLMVTDPPYGVEYSPEWRNEWREKVGKAVSERVGRIAGDDDWDWADCLKLFKGDVMYVWHAGLYGGRVFNNIESIGFEIRAQIIWVKSVQTFGRGHYHWKHEPCYFAERQGVVRKEHDPCYYAVREGGDANWQGSRTESTIWETGVDLQDVTIHSTQKPLAVIHPPIKNHTSEGDSVYDPFLGSGTTLIASQQLNRVCYGLEIKPEFVDVIIARFQRYCGEKIYYHRDGKRHLLAE